MTAKMIRAEPYVLEASDRLAGMEGPVDLRVLAMSKQTAGAFSVFDYTAPPHFPGPPLHRHRDEDEAYLVIEGVLTIQSGEERHVVEPGGFIWAPRGQAHGFANLSNETTRFIGFVAPAGLEELFFEIADHIAETGGEVDQDELMRINQRYVEVLGPPIGADPS